jgi:hypothetical protein
MRPPDYCFGGFGKMRARPCANDVSVMEGRSCLRRSITIDMSGGLW